MERIHVTVRDVIGLAHSFIDYQLTQIPAIWLPTFILDPVAWALRGS